MSRRLAVAHRLLAGLAVLAVALVGPSAATATGSRSATLGATLEPERLGQGTTLGFEIRIASHGATPVGLAAFSLSYPADLGIGLSGLGLATCESQALQERGPSGCPSQSVMGYGRAVAEIPYGTQLLAEPMRVAIFRAPTQAGRFELLVHATGSSPAIADLTFPGMLAPAPAPYGGQVEAALPTVPWLPGAPDVALVSFGATLGPLHVTYRERVHGRLVAYHPRGILLPSSCPRGGFAFAARLTFADGARASARTVVPCPRSGFSKRADQ